MKKYQALIGIAISVLFLYIAFRQSDFGQIWNLISGLHLKPLLFSTLILFAAFWLRAVRWKYLLESSQNVSVHSLFSAIMIGYMTLNVLPLRLGEFIRAYVLGRREKLAVSAVFATVVVERIFDGFTILSALIVAIFFFDLNVSPLTMQWVKAFSYLGLAVYVAALVVVLLIKLNIKLVLNILDLVFRRLPGFKQRLAGMVRDFANGLAAIDSWRIFFKVIAASLAVWATMAVGMWVFMFGFTGADGYNMGSEVGLSGALFLVGAVALGVMIPAGPAFVGTFELAVITALAGVGVSRPMAEGYAIVIHAAQAVPVIIVGVIYLYAHHFSFKEVRQSGEQAKAGLEHSGDF